jgi:acetoin utilization deacetylase AcuC-like enzyme
MEEIVFYYPKGHEAHFRLDHSERPERVEAILAILIKSQLWNTFPHIDPLLIPDEVLKKIHDPIYLQRIEDVSRESLWLDPNTYTTLASWQLALGSAGGSISVAKSVWEKNAKRGFALTRPPGHHATITQKKGQHMGYCLINNIAIAAEYLLQKEGAQRLAIIDLDLHHGNGTQDIFWERSDVLYISTHETPLYPWQGNLHDVGVGKGEGATANIPLPPYSGDQAFKSTLSAIILPLLDRFQPEMLLISIGFDTHWKDPYGHLLNSVNGIASIISNLSNWADSYCDSRIAMFLEGGYDLDVIKECALATTQALLGQPWLDNIGAPPRPETDSWKPVIDQAREFWRL